MQPIKRPLLFITWDSDKSNYLESLFFPTLQGIQKQGGIRCHVIQFSWAGEDEVERLRKNAKTLGIVYTHRPVRRKPNADLGAMWTVFCESRFLRRYIRMHDISIVLPRSTMPAMMVNRCSRWMMNRNIHLVYDADGLPIEERVDYVGLNPKGIKHKWLKSVETKIIRNASKVLTRTNRSVSFLVRGNENSTKKYAVVSNGRDKGFYRRDIEDRASIRNSLGLGKDSKLWIYSGTLGPQYQVEEMLLLFRQYHRRNRDSQFLLLTRDKEYLYGKIPETMAGCIKVRTVEFKNLPAYLSAADVALCLRRKGSSLAGIAPIKLGEYLMMELPVILSPGIGDFDSILTDKDFCFLYDPSSPDRFENACRWVDGLKNEDLKGIRPFAVENFALEKSIAEYLQPLNELYELG